MGLDNFPAGALVVGLTLEKINPTFERVMLSRMDVQPQLVQTWDHTARDWSEFKSLMTTQLPAKQQARIWGSPSPKNNPTFFPFTATKYDVARSSCGAKTMYYLHGDEFDKTTWNKLETVMRQENEKFNIIFADAYKHLAASMYECNNLIDRGLIDFEGPWAYFWDDDLKNDHCTGRLGQAAGKPISHGTITANGWLGSHEFRHFFGIVTNMDTTPLRTALTKSRVKCQIWDHVTRKKRHCWLG
eukprot:gnl/TRDRNA2_/TRDRNA2_74324_c1_seq2.p1 gnl/TRDRNA2_/TRDRNA2_74324_c1~~gnl/TRDRNA2_/TRDRNA2_74324_c1_seq2.p1  ORF type:complete len:281 (+),score=39.14 gnl/TRDRNA2_/TRDRNA2_74324_c1_seq2:114-845(+)